jgi:hypothetical protein
MDDLVFLYRIRTGKDRGPRTWLGTNCDIQVPFLYPTDCQGTRTGGRTTELTEPQLDIFCLHRWVVLPYTHARPHARTYTLT